MILQALLVQILLGIALGWLDKATTGKRFKHSEWLLRHPLLVQYLLALVLNLVAVSVVYHPYREFMGSLLRTPLYAAAMLVGIQLVRLGLLLRDSLKGKALAKAEAEDAPAAEVTEHAPLPEAPSPPEVFEDDSPAQASVALPASDTAQRRKRLDSTLDKY